MTKSGYTARRVSKFRPRMNIIASTPSDKTYHQLALSWGVYPVRALFQSDINVLFRHAIDSARRDDLVKEGDSVVITAGEDGSTDILRVQRVPKRR